MEYATQRFIELSVTKCPM